MLPVAIITDDDANITKTRVEKPSANHPEAAELKNKTNEIQVDNKDAEGQHNSKELNDSE